MTKVNFMAAGQTTATVVVMVVVVFRDAARRATLPWRVSGTLPAESTAAQTETLSSRRLFMYETVAYVHRSPFHRVRLLRFVPCVHEQTCALFIRLGWMMSDVYSSRAPRKLRREVGKSRTRLPS